MDATDKRCNKQTDTTRTRNEFTVNNARTDGKDCTLTLVGIVVVVNTVLFTQKKAVLFTLITVTNFFAKS